MSGRGRQLAVAVAMSAAVALSGCSQLQRIGDNLTGTTDADLLAAVSLTEGDAAEGAVYQPYEGGDEVFGRTSLDLCYADFPSEQLRTARHQVGIGDPGGTAWVSSEAILYSTPGDAEQAVAELEKARAQCPVEAVQPPEPEREALTWDFLADPDSDWPQVPGITRRSYEFQATNPAGESFTSTTTYLQRGRMILALYATPPEGPSSTLRNAPDQARFVEVMSNRLAGLPEEPLQYGPPLDDPNDITV